MPARRKTVKLRQDGFSFVGKVFARLWLQALLFQLNPFSWKSNIFIFNLFVTCAVSEDAEKQTISGPLNT
jgi:hypothetical protein